MAGSPLHQLDYWQSALSRPLSERVAPGSAALVDFITLDNLRSGLPERPRLAQPPADFMQDLQAVVEGLPPRVRACLQRKLLGIFLVDHIGSTGYTEQVTDAAGKPVAGFIVLDPSTLDRTANAWASWKENTPFQPGADFRLEAEIEPPAQDSRRNALQYILLHEIGHVLTIGTTLAPSWDVPIRAIGPVQGYRFTRLSWQLSPDGQQLVSRQEPQFPERREVVYYRQPRLPASAMLPVYTHLQASGFVTLYGATNPYDDFAEAFVSYVHVVLLHKPFAIRIYQRGHLTLSYGACWGQPRCAAKQAILRELLDAN